MMALRVYEARHDQREDRESECNKNEQKNRDVRVQHLLSDGVFAPNPPPALAETPRPTPLRRGAPRAPWPSPAGYEDQVLAPHNDLTESLSR